MPLSKGQTKMDTDQQAERRKLLEDRTDLTDDDPELGALLEKMPLHALRLVIEKVPRSRSPKSPFETDGVKALRAMLATQVRDLERRFAKLDADEAPAHAKAVAAPPTDYTVAQLDSRMGLAPEPQIRNTGTRLYLPSMTPAQAKRELARRESLRRTR